MYYVYILKGNRYYVGSTCNITRRIQEHKRFKTKTVNRIGEWKLEGYFVKDTKEEGEKLEKMIKRNGHIDYWINHETFIKH